MSKNAKETATFVAPGKARDNFSDATLRRWAKDGKIKSIITPTGRRLYDAEGIGGTRSADAEVVYRNIVKTKGSSSALQGDNPSLLKVHNSILLID